MYLTVKEAIEVSGKSQTTVHRLCQKHEKSKHIKKENNKYLIDKDFLLENYPVDEVIIENNQFVNLEKNKQLSDLNEKIIELDEKANKLNSRVAELTIANKTLIKKLEEKDRIIRKNEEELFDNQHELAETIEANTNMEKELASIKNIPTFLNNDDDENESKFEDNKTFITKVITITVSLIVLSSFIFGMYHFTK